MRKYVRIQRNKKLTGVMKDSFPSVSLGINGGDYPIKVNFGGF